MVDQYGSFDFTPLKYTVIITCSHGVNCIDCLLSRPTLLWKLDMKEDSSRRKMKLLPNINGSNHSDAIRSTTREELTEEQKQR